jgi:hypothetical protein
VLSEVHIGHAPMMPRGDGWRKSSSHWGRNGGELLCVVVGNFGAECRGGSRRYFRIHPTRRQGNVIFNETFS